MMVNLPPQSFMMLLNTRKKYFTGGKSQKCDDYEPSGRSQRNTHLCKSLTQLLFSDFIANWVTYENSVNTAAVEEIQ